MISEYAQSNLADDIAVIRDFNRFYTARLGLLRKRHLDGEFSLTEARILYEIGANPRTTAAALREVLGLDRGYISRSLALLAKRRLMRTAPSGDDGREKLLLLTVTGEKSLARLNEQSDKQVQQILANLHTSQREALTSALSSVKAILGETNNSAVRIVRLNEETAEARQILEEYYDAVHVVQRDKPGSIRKVIGDDASGMWLAYMEDKVVGCVILKRLTSILRASECKRLYVKPSARGHHIADKLLDAQEDYARNAGVSWIYLDSYDDLKPAIALYKRRGYEQCKRYNDNPQATLFMRKQIGKSKA